MSRILQAITEFDWTPATTNKDGSPIISGEVTGYTVGVRPASGSVGTYPFSLSAPSDAVKALPGVLNTVLPTGVDLVAAIQSTGPKNSDWAETDVFQLAVPLPVPNAPTGFTGA